MRALIQRVTKASVTINKKLKVKIGQGYVVLLGVKEGDNEKKAKLLADKVVKLRIMADSQKKMNKSILDVNGQILVISQFTLLADTKKGRRPSFVKAALPEVSKPLYDLFVEELTHLGVKKVVTGEFGAYMEVEIINDGPVTIWLDY